MQDNHCQCPKRCLAEAWKKEADAWMCKYADLKKKLDAVREKNINLQNRLENILRYIRETLSDDDCKGY